MSFTWPTLTLSIFFLAIPIVYFFLKMKNQKIIKQLELAKKDLIIGNFQNLSFEEFSNPSIMARKTQLFAMGYVQNMSGETTRLSLNLINMITDKEKYLAKFSPEVQKQINNGSLKLMAGDKLFAVSSSNGRIVEQARLVNQSLSGISKVAAIANFTIGVSNFISNYDSAKKLSLVNENVSLLLQNRATDMIDELRTIFSSIKGLNPSKIDEDRAFIRALQYKAKNLRFKWIAQINNSLEHLEDHKCANWLMQQFYHLSGERSQKKFVEQQDACLLPLYLIRTTVETERSLSALLDEELIFYQQSLPELKDDLKKLSYLLESKKENLQKVIKLNPNQIQVASHEIDNFLLSLALSGDIEEFKTNFKKKASY